MSAPDRPREPAADAPGAAVEIVGGARRPVPPATYGRRRLASRIHLRLARVIGPDRVLGNASVTLDADDVYLPDVVALGDLPARAEMQMGTPLLAVLVLEGESAARDRETKAPRLVTGGVQEVWLVDPEAETIEVRRGYETETAHHEDELRSRAVPGFGLAPARLFTAPIP